MLAKPNFNANILTSLIKEGHLDERVIEYMNKFNFCDTFKCLPNDLKKISSLDYHAFLSILRGRNKNDTTTPNQNYK